jgi:exodeoxyribonuclease V alpha subunit
MLVPAYDTTIHKSQGSEYPAVVIPAMTQHYAMLNGIFSTRHHTRQTAGRLGRVEEGSRYSSAQCVRSPPLVETARMVVSETCWLTCDRK